MKKKRIINTNWDHNKNKRRLWMVIWRSMEDKAMVLAKFQFLFGCRLMGIPFTAFFTM